MVQLGLTGCSDQPGCCHVSFLGLQAKGLWCTPDSSACLLGAAEALAPGVGPGQG